ncbi:hypothetical protein J6590_069723 [Homalodisca vitripennis]|nr:hypothetical protein J6590_069723 [Homalodisca vitripennis]
MGRLTLCKGQIFLYADDTALLFEGESWEEVRDVAERGLLTVKRWFDQCRLTVNIAKTKCMPISIRADGDPFVFNLRLNTCGGQDGCVLCECIDRKQSRKPISTCLEESDLARESSKSKEFSGKTPSLTTSLRENRLQDRRLRLLDNKSRVSSIRREKKAAQTLSIVVGGFIVCWLPFFVAYLLAPFIKPTKIPDELMFGLTWLGWINSAINPFIYAFYSPDFRLAFWRLTFRNCTARQVVSMELSTSSRQSTYDTLGLDLIAIPTSWGTETPASDPPSLLNDLRETPKLLSSIKVLGQKTL